MMSKTKEDPNELAPVPSQAGEVRDMPTYVTDDVFGEVTENGPNYRNVRTLRRVSSRTQTDSLVGRMDRNSGAHDEVPDRPWSPFHSNRL